MALAAKASYRTEAAWGQTSGGLFTFGLSTFGGSDKLAAATWSQTFLEPNANLTYQSSDGSYVEEFTTVRGRADDLSAMQAGTAEVVIRDPGARYNRENTGSPLYGFLDAMVPLRISGTYQGATNAMYYGFIDRIDWSPVAGRGGRATISCVDFFTWLAQRKPVIAPTGPTTTGAVLGLLLDDVRWTDPSLRNLATGDQLTGFSADGTKTSLAIAEELLISERGAFYIAKNGAPTYRDRHYALTQAPVAAVTDKMTQLSTGTDRALVKNQLTVTALPGGVPQVASDSASQDKYGFYDDTIGSAYLRDDNQALALAQWLVLLQKTPTTRVWETKLRNTEASLLTQMLQRDLYDTVTLSAARGSTSGDYVIQQIVHRVSLGGGVHETTWRCSEKPPVSPFIFGTSTFGGSDVLGY